MKAADVVDILTENDSLERRLTEFCEQLVSREQYDEEQGYSIWPSDNEILQCAYCTSAAKLVAREFHGKVVGYLFDDVDAQRTKVAADSGGHDFAIVGDYLVDYWAWSWEETIPRPVLSLTRDAEFIAEHYLPPEFWEVTEDCTV